MARKPAPPQKKQKSIDLQGDLDVFSIQAQWEGLQVHLSSQEDSMLLDLTPVGDLDLSGLQLLLALNHHLASRGGRLSLSGVKPEWLERFRPMGLGALLEEGP